jgi:hypothetical protein
MIDIADDILLASVKAHRLTPGLWLDCHMPHTTININAPNKFIVAVLRHFLKAGSTHKSAASSCLTSH